MKNINRIIAILILTVIILTTIPTHIFAAGTETFDKKNLLITSNITKEELEYALKGNLKELSATYIEAEKETGVNAIFIAAISALESGWGKSYMATHMNNLFGYGKKTFSSKEECILHVAKALKENYLSKDGPFYNGTSVSSVEICYCPSPVGEWSGLVSQIMIELDSEIQEYRKTHPVIVETEEITEDITIVKQQKYKQNNIIKEKEFVLDKKQKAIDSMLLVSDIIEDIHELIKIID